MYIDHHAEYFWLVMTGLKEKKVYFNTQIRVYHDLFTDGTTNYILQLKILMV